MSQDRDVVERMCWWDRYFNNSLPQPLIREHCHPRYRVGGLDPAGFDETQIEEDLRDAVVEIECLRARVEELEGALTKIATQDLDEGDLPGLGEEVMLADAVSIARRALAREGE